MVRSRRRASRGPPGLKDDPPEPDESGRSKPQANRRLRRPPGPERNVQEMRRLKRNSDTGNWGTDNIDRAIAKPNANKNVPRRGQRLPRSRGAIRHDVGEQRVVRARPPDDFARLVHPIRCQRNGFHRSPLPRHAPDDKCR